MWLYICVNMCLFVFFNKNSKCGWIYFLYTEILSECRCTTWNTGFNWSKFTTMCLCNFWFNRTTTRQRSVGTAEPWKSTTGHNGKATGRLSVWHLLVPARADVYLVLRTWTTILISFPLTHFASSIQDTERAVFQGRGGGRAQKQSLVHHYAYPNRKIGEAGVFCNHNLTWKQLTSSHQHSTSQWAHVHKTSQCVQHEESKHTEEPSTFSFLHKHYEWQNAWHIRLLFPINIIILLTHYY